MSSNPRRSLHLIGSFLLALLIACGTASPVIAGTEVAVVVSAVDALIVGRGQAKPNDPLYSGDEVLLLHEGSLTFRFKDGRLVKLDGGSRARISHSANQDGAIEGDVEVLLGQGWLVNAETGEQVAPEENLITNAGSISEGGDTTSDGDASGAPLGPKKGSNGAQGVDPFPLANPVDPPGGVDPTEPPESGGGLSNGDGPTRAEGGGDPIGTPGGREGEPITQPATPRMVTPRAPMPRPKGEPSPFGSGNALGVGPAVPLEEAKAAKEAKKASDLVINALEASVQSDHNVGGASLSPQGADFSNPISKEATTAVPALKDRRPRVIVRAPAYDVRQNISRAPAGDVRRSGRVVNRRGRR